MTVSHRSDLDPYRLIFTATAGRTGTMLLSDLLSLLPGVHTEHEPLPDVSRVWWRLRVDPTIAHRWLVQSKLGAVLKSLQTTNSSIYVETSHMLCKGFFEPLIDMGIRFDLILLSRSLHDIAVSLYALQDIPMRSIMGRRWLPSPDDTTNISVLPTPYDQWSDYQLVYWYVLEMELRKMKYRAYWESMNWPVTETSISELRTRTGFTKLLKDLDLPDMPIRSWQEHRALCMVKRNAKSSEKSFFRNKGVVEPVVDIKKQELTVRRAINYDAMLEACR